MNGAEAAADQLDFSLLLKEMKDVDEAAMSVAEGLRVRTARAVGAAEEELDVENPLRAYGVDSLVAVIGSDVGVFEITGLMSFVELGRFAVERGRFWKGA